MKTGSKRGICTPMFTAALSAIAKIWKKYVPVNIWMDREDVAYIWRNIIQLWKTESEVVQSRLTLCDPMDCNLPGSSIHGIFQARILEWGAISFSRRSSWPRDWTLVSRIVGKRFTIWATREVHWQVGTTLSLAGSLWLAVSRLLFLDLQTSAETDSGLSLICLHRLCRL